MKLLQKKRNVSLTRLHKKCGCDHPFPHLLGYENTYKTKQTALIASTVALIKIFPVILFLECKQEQN